MVAGAIVFELGDLRKVGGIDQQQAGDRAGGGGEHNQQNKQRVADELQPATARFGGVSAVTGGSSTSRFMS